METTMAKPGRAWRMSLSTARTARALAAMSVSSSSPLLLLLFLLLVSAVPQHGHGATPVVRCQLDLTRRTFQVLKPAPRYGLHNREAAPLQVGAVREWQTTARWRLGDRSITHEWAQSDKDEVFVRKVIESVDGKSAATVKWIEYHGPKVFATFEEVSLFDAQAAKEEDAGEDGSSPETPLPSQSATASAEREERLGEGTVALIVDPKREMYIRMNRTQASWAVKQKEKWNRLGQGSWRTLPGL